MEKKEVLLKVTNILKPEFVGFGIEVSDQSEFSNDLNLDSLDKVDIVMCCENEFDIHISDSMIDGFKTIGNLVDHIHEMID
jgi:acyl carrier protein